MYNDLSDNLVNIGLFIFFLALALFFGTLTSIMWFSYPDISLEPENKAKETIVIEETINVNAKMFMEKAEASGCCGCCECH